MKIVAGPLTALLLTMAASTALAAERHPGSYRNHGLNGSAAPVTADGITTFHIRNEECSDVDYGDGRGESDCRNGNVRSQISQTHNIGDTVEYRFDIRIDPAITFRGRFDELAYRLMPDGWDTSLSVAHWEGNRLHNYMHRLKLDTTKGLTFHGEVCQAPEAFGEWVTFTMKVRWANDARGWIKVTCDDRVLYAAEGAPSTRNPHCYIRNQCEPGLRKEPTRVHSQLGLLSHGHGMAWKDMNLRTPFQRIQDDGITVQMRNIETLPNPVLYGDAEKEQVRALQIRLNELGCDVGEPDGVAGARTRAAALSCRAFPEGTLPDAYNVATLPAFVEAYAAAGAADLAPGRLPGADLVSATNEVIAGEDFSLTWGDKRNVHSELVATVAGRDTPIRFAIIGFYDARSRQFANLSFALLEPIEQPLDAIADCGAGAGVERPFGGDPVVGLRFQRKDSAYVIENADCILSKAPRNQRQRLAFLIDNFADIAVGMARDGTLATIRNDSLRDFIGRVAYGEISVGRD